MILRTLHRTRYDYPHSVAESFNETRLMPLSDEAQTCLQFTLCVQPHTHLYSYELPGGAVHAFNIREPHSCLEITARSIVETHRANPFIHLKQMGDDWQFYTRDDVRQDYAEYLSPTRLVPPHPEATRIGEAALQKAGPSAASFAVTLTTHLGSILKYEPGATHAHTRLDEFLHDRRGVCQDFAHLMLAVCRSRGIPARYVSGYVYSRHFEAMHAEMATHAWVECLMPPGIWVGFDPTNDLVVNDRFVKIHVGRDYADVAPTRGLYWGAGAHKLTVEVRVELEQPTTVSV